MSNRTTIRKYLSQHYLKLNTTDRPYDSESKNSDDHFVEAVYRWEDFDIEHVNKRFGKVLDASIESRRLPSPPTVYPEQLAISNERSFESLLLTHTAHVINNALREGIKIWNQMNGESKPSVLWLSGSYFGSESSILPDWGAMEQRPDSGPKSSSQPSSHSSKVSFVCGDTKYVTHPLKIQYGDSQARSTPSKTPSQNQTRTQLSPSSPSLGRGVQRRNFSSSQAAIPSPNLGSLFSSSNSSPPSHTNMPQTPKRLLESLPSSNASNKFSTPAGTQRETAINSWLSQVNGYATLHQTRYCYIISPHSIIVCRRFLEKSKPPSTPKTSDRVRDRLAHKSTADSGGLLGSRFGSAGGMGGSSSLRNPQQYHNSQSTISSSSPSPPTAPQNSQSSNASFIPVENDSFLDVAEVEWPTQAPLPSTTGITNTGLNVNLALWAVHMLAATGDRTVKTNYSSDWDGN
ncbi:hypothetical protein VTL71DRAFT_9453 [Oculimacula yallundae]|uniref:Uncharacterized protein n=1 Tax=Oculimacula yallundae TaxID=86028 RepID=A0ABR4BS21_9HELO